MRKYVYLLFDVLAALISLLAALYLRNGWGLIEEGGPDDLHTLLIISVVVSLIVLPIMKIPTRMWRYTSGSDLTAILIAATFIVLFINGGLFLFNRLEIVPRSVPPIHLALMLLLMAGSRLGVRWLLGPVIPEAHHGQATQHVLIVGINQVAELYITFASKILSGQVSIEGLIDEHASLIGRSFHHFPILGTPEQLGDVMERLLVHGITISKLILVQPFERFSPASQQALQELEHKGLVELVDFERQIGLSVQASASQPLAAAPQIKTTVVPRGYYPKIKRGIDVLGAAVLLVITAPLLLLTTVLVFVDVGTPILFWQKRPGLHGRAFKLYKFRTMRPAGRKHNEDRLTHKSGDRARTSFVGQWLRRLRLDELPQLFMILSGTMSFIGPRPLLPEDQPKGGRQRLEVRPGITGWAQVNGGDALSPQQKLVFDIWYIQKMSLRLDIYITLRTFVAVLQKDKPRLEALRSACEQLGLAPEEIFEADAAQMTPDTQEAGYVRTKSV